MDDTLETLRTLKRTLSYPKLSKLTGAPQQALYRWLTGKTHMSAAWQSVIEQNLKG
jgi:hypothetical protein